MKLAELQQFFARAATTTTGPIEALDDVFVGSSTLPASARLAIYNRGYYYRLLDSLSSVFGQTRRLLGDALFERIGLRYLSEHPSEHPAVERIGRAFVAHLLESSDLARSEELTPAVVDVAALEWARLCSLVAPNPAQLVAAKDIEASAFPESQLKFVAALQLLELDARALEAFAAGDPAQARAAALGRSDQPSPRVGVAVFRQAHSVRHDALSALEYQALLAAHSGQRMQQVCAIFDTGQSASDAQQAFQVIAGWFSRGWVERCGLLR